MFPRTIWIHVALIVLFASSLAGCIHEEGETTKSSTPVISETAPIRPTTPAIPTGTPDQLTPVLDLSEYAFPALIEPAKQYMFYLHGKIIEDQGIPAISPEYGEYEYQAILERLGGYGLAVISEQRPGNTDSIEYARKVAQQVTALMNAGVPASHITVVGASKGGGIVLYVSHFLGSRDINYVILSACNPETVEYYKQNQIALSGNILSIYDSVDELAGSCRELFSFSEGKGISRYDEIVLNIGTGHGILYHPLDEWVLPTVRWAGKP